MLNDVSVEYFERTRTAWFGMPLAEFEKKGGEGGQMAFENARAPLREFAELLGRGRGPRLCWAGLVSCQDV
jgi:hypothetical protein